MKLFTYGARAVVLILGLVPVSAFAVSVSFDTPPGTAAAGDMVVVRAYLDPGSDVLNALDGKITFQSDTAGFRVTDVSIAGSALTVWPTPAKIASDAKSVAFTAGTPGGIVAAHALLLTTVLTTEAPGIITVDAPEVSAYKNDGKGTEVPVAHHAFTLTISPHVAGTPVRDELKEIIGTDTTPPDPFTVTLGHDPSVFDGRTFIMFQSADSQSGIDHYTVQEGSLAPVTASAPYVLSEQNFSEHIVVSAYDKAGNIQRAALDTGSAQNSVYTMWLIGIVLMLVVGYIVWRVRRRTQQ